MLFAMMDNKSYRQRIIVSLMMIWIRHQTKKIIIINKVELEIFLSMLTVSLDLLENILFLPTDKVSLLGVWSHRQKLKKMHKEGQQGEVPGCDRTSVAVSDRTFGTEHARYLVTMLLCIGSLPSVTSERRPATSDTILTNSLLCLAVNRLHTAHVCTQINTRDVVSSVYRERTTQRMR